AQVAAIRDRFEQSALAALAAVVPGVRATVAGVARAPHIASLAFPGVPAEPLLHALEARGVFASAGSACASKTAGPSPTLKAIGGHERTGVLRLSLCRETTDPNVAGDVRAVAEAADLEAISEAAVEEAQAAIARTHPASFKVEARRADKRFPVPSMDIARRVGGSVWKATGLPVDVHTPALRVGVEVATDVAFVYAG